MKVRNVLILLVSVLQVHEAIDLEAALEIPDSIEVLIKDPKWTGKAPLSKDELVDSPIAEKLNDLLGASRILEFVQTAELNRKPFHKEKCDVNLTNKPDSVGAYGDKAARTSEIIDKLVKMSEASNSDKVLKRTAIGGYLRHHKAVYGCINNLAIKILSHADFRDVVGTGVDLEKARMVIEELLAVSDGNQAKGLNWLLWLERNSKMEEEDQKGFRKLALKSVTISYLGALHSKTRGGSHELHKDYQMDLGITPKDRKDLMDELMDKGKIGELAEYLSITAIPPKVGGDKQSKSTSQVEVMSYDKGTFLRLAENDQRDTCEAAMATISHPSVPFASKGETILKKHLTQICEYYGEFDTGKAAEAPINRLFLMLSLHHDQNTAKEIYSSLLKECKWEDETALSNIAAANQALFEKDNAAIIAHLKGRAYFNLRPIQIRREIEALWATFKQEAIPPGWETKFEGSKIAPELSKEPCLEMSTAFNDFLTRWGSLYDEHKKKKTPKANMDKLRLVHGRMATKFMQDVVKEEGMREEIFVEMMLKAIDQEHREIFLGVCTTIAAAPCKDLPLRILERYRTQTLLLLDNENRAGDEKARKEGLQGRFKCARKYRTYLEKINKWLKEHYNTKAKSTAPNPALADFQPMMAAGGGKMSSRGGTSLVVTTPALSDIVEVEQSFDLNVVEAVKITEPVELHMIRSSIAPWTGINLVRKLPDDDDLLSEVLIHIMKTERTYWLPEFLGNENLKPTFQFTRGYKLFLLQALKTLSDQNCFPCPKIDLNKHDMSIGGIAGMEAAKCPSEEEMAKQASSAFSPSPSAKAPKTPAEFIGLEDALEPVTEMEEHLMVFCDLVKCPYMKVENSRMPDYTLPRGMGVTDRNKPFSLLPPADGVIERWLLDVLQMFKEERELGSQSAPRPKDEYAFMVSMIRMAVKYMAFDVEDAHELLNYIMANLTLPD